MFLINRETNQAITVQQKTFSELEFKERQNLQEWIEKNTDILGESLLVIQKEFSGFLDTNERLDLLAIDENGDLVLIENKLDDSGRDVVWQALKYVSYCSSLTKLEIKEIYQNYLFSKGSNEKAEDNILNFLNASDFDEVKLNSGDQRMILVAAQFRKEVTSTVTWLMDHNVNIKCVKVTPYQCGEQVFLEAKQILPTPDLEEFQIKLSFKKQEENKTNEEIALRHKLRYAFWTKAIPELQKTADLYHNVSPTKDNWITGASGHSGISYNSVVIFKGARAELYISKPNQTENKRIFDYLFQQKGELEKQFGEPLDWNRLDDKIACRISICKNEFSLQDENDWSDMMEFLGNKIRKLKEVFAKPIEQALRQLN